VASGEKRATGARNDDAVGDDEAAAGAEAGAGADGRFDMAERAKMMMICAGTK
jgi:hypothetical protein